MMSRVKKPAASPPAVPIVPPSAEAAGSSSAGPAASSPAAAEPSTAAAASPPRRTLGRLLFENPQFVSSVVIGGAGLIATSLYQWNQSKLAQRQAEWQERRELSKADNDWRIERAKILAQNLQTLTARGGDTAEQRYGVLLSLTRGNILDPDLAVSYALELGKDSPEYMHSVLLNVERKDAHHYQRLASAYLPTCSQRFGLTVPTMTVCHDDTLSERSNAIADVVADDTEATLIDGVVSGPRLLLQDERGVHLNLLRYVGLFGGFVSDVYERRQWEILDRFLASSTGSRLIGNFALLMQSTDITQTADNDTIQNRFDLGRSWLESYITGPSCDIECRGRAMSVIVSNLSRGQGQFRLLLRSLLKRQRPEVQPFLNRLRARLLACQISPEQMPALRDDVLLPALLAAAAAAKPDQPLLDDLLGELQLLPLASDSAADWKKLLGLLPAATGGRHPALFFSHLAEDQRRRKLAAAVEPSRPAPTSRPTPLAESSSLATKSKPLMLTAAPASAQTSRASRNFCAAITQYRAELEESEE